MTHTAHWWHISPDDSKVVVCDLCPRTCTIKPGGQGFCFVRQNQPWTSGVEAGTGRLVNATYGRSTGFCVDPIEKKPLNHFYPGSAVLSFGTAGCNLSCKFCQNWTSSRSRQVDISSEKATPRQIARACQELGIQNVAFTYNDPIIWAEYAIDTAVACHDLGIRTVAVTAGFIEAEPRIEFFRHMDAANVDLKGFTEEFYEEYTGGKLSKVCETLEYLARETDVWLEITNLVIPQANDDLDDIRRMCDWIVKRLGTDVPVHFSAFHPDFHMTDRPPTSPDLLLKIRDMAIECGIRYAYTGNIAHPASQNTYCHACGATIITREGYQIGRYELLGNRCRFCNVEIPGRFGERQGDWGSRRQPVHIADFADANETTSTHQTSSSRKQSTKVSQSMSTLSDRSPQEHRPGPSIPKLTAEQKSAIFQAAGRRVAAAVYRSEPERLDQVLSDIAMTPLIGAFVTLKRAGQLRSCCGTMSESMPLYQAVDYAAVRTATDDPRFPPISAAELGQLDMDVWLLAGMQQEVAKGEDRVNVIEIGRHGVQIARGRQRGLLLPGVAVEHKMDQRAFLEAVCRKAGLPLDAWLDDDTVLHTFVGLEIQGPFSSVKLDRLAMRPETGPTVNEIERLCGFSMQNFMALVQGATPSFYLPGVSDSSVSGVVVSVAFPGDDVGIQVSKVALRSELPLQSTLFELIKGAVSVAAERRVSPAMAMRATIQLAVMTDPVMHGTLAEPSLEGMQTAKRALMLLSEGQWAIGFDQEASAEALLEKTTDVGKFHDTPSCHLLSFRMITNLSKPLSLSNLGQPRNGVKMRRPAVAGQFYPGRADEIKQMLDNMLPSQSDPQDYPAIMVPHAGWVYSGRLAAETFSRVRLPKRIIIFAPRHRGIGADWAVAPHEIWQLPTGELRNDVQLARKLADTIDGLELDAAAHLQEHAIEVQLPIIARLSPESNVVGITIGRGEWDALARFARQLADVIREMDEPPLLVISSDMNHFANLNQTERVDRIALDAIESLDPRNVLDTVNKHHISMCGVCPCTLVMQTLKEMGKLNRCEPVGYYTSADASGDTSRVVGYAGMLFR